MANTISMLPFSGTQEQENQLKNYISDQKGRKGALMPIMQYAQHLYGYLPIEVQKIIASELDIPLEEVYGVSTFYSQFNLNPNGKYKISVCLGTACYVKGSGDILEEISKNLGIKSGETTPDGLFTLEACRCIGACGLAPVFIISDDVHGRVVKDEVISILDNYKE